LGILDFELSQWAKNRLPSDAPQVVVVGLIVVVDLAIVEVQVVSVVG